MSMRRTTFFLCDVLVASAVVAKPDLERISLGGSDPQCPGLSRSRLCTSAGLTTGSGDYARSLWKHMVCSGEGRPNQSTLFKPARSGLEVVRLA